MTASCTCGATWSGHRIEHCPACHQTFTGTSAGDKHRVGDHAVSRGPNRRRCLTPDEMRARGMGQNGRGQWTATTERDPRFAQTPQRADLGKTPAAAQSSPPSPGAVTPHEGGDSTTTERTDR